MVECAKLWTHPGQVPFAKDNGSQSGFLIKLYAGADRGDMSNMGSAMSCVVTFDVRFTLSSHDTPYTRGSSCKSFWRNTHHSLEALTIIYCGGGGGVK